MKTSLRQIDDFFQLKRLAVVGVSRNPKETSYTLWQEFRQRRYDAVPVNPNATEIDGKPCFARVQDITPPVEGVVIVTTPKVTDQVVRDCAEAGVKHIWMYRGVGGGAVSKDAVAFAESNGMDVVEGFCPFMFLLGTPFFHKLHGYGKKLTGSYPK